MTTQIQLCNRAITRCGGARIMDLSESGKSARALSAVYDQVRDSCLSVANWRFALAREELAATTVQDGYTYAYIIPSNWLRFVEIRDRWVGVPMLGPRYISDFPSEFQIETDRTLLTNYGPPLKARGVRRIEDTSLYDALFNDYFTLSLAVEIWEDISRKSVTKLNLIIDERNKALSVARANNAIQEAPEEINDTAWLLSRVGP